MTPGLEDSMTIRTIYGSTVVITGATSGIGRETAREFARAGAHVDAAGRREVRLRVLVGEIEGQGGEALAVRTDVSDPTQVGRLIEKAAERIGRIETLVNNAGVCSEARIGEQLLTAYRCV